MKEQDAQSIVKGLKAKARSKEYLKGMSRFGIETKYAIGVSVPTLRATAKVVGKQHKLALELWKTKIHEARILATMVDDPLLVTEKQMEDWVKDFNSWDICDQCCGNLFDKTKFAYRKAMSWSKSEPEYTRRAGFAMMASLAVHNKQMKDSDFVKFFPVIEKFSYDERNFVRKAVNWALRQIGKRNKALNKQAIKCGESLRKKDSRSAKWIAADALRELKSDAVQRRLNA